MDGRRRHQSLDLQTDALRQSGVERVLSNVASGERDDRPGLADALAALNAGDPARRLGLATRATETKLQCYR
jgi:DNA invertase Pin-like site-specific DNA recombinase